MSPDSDVLFKYIAMYTNTTANLTVNGNGLSVSAGSRSGEYLREPQICELFERIVVSRVSLCPLFDAVS